MTADSLHCVIDGCGRTRKTDSEFCPSCHFQTAREADVLVEETSRWLGLEAEFVAWCSAHGLPNPHE